ncbi:UNVERIFIED_CONTAM: hypothetical protein FKN15_065547 [Acipenser sinensis]
MLSGHVQSRQSIEEVIRFAASEGLYLLVDEVYQDSVFGQGRAFLSYKKVLYEMGPEFSSRVELAAIHSASKGVAGECGSRCGFIEFVNLDPQVKSLSASYFSANSLPPTSGQLVLVTALHPPRAGEPSYYTWTQESQSHLSSLSRNAALVVESLDRIPGIRVLSPQGGFFCFPRIHIPPLVVQEAETQGLSPDLFYCLRFLEEWGVAVGPGSDFGAREGFHHIRMINKTNYCAAKNNQNSKTPDEPQRQKTLCLKREVLWKREFYEAADPVNAELQQPFNQDGMKTAARRENILIESASGRTISAD